MLDTRPELAQGAAEATVGSKRAECTPTGCPSRSKRSVWTLDRGTSSSPSLPRHPSHLCAVLPRASHVRA